MATLILHYAVSRNDEVELNAGIQPDMGRWEPWPTHGDLCAREDLVSLSQKALQCLSEAREVMQDAADDDDVAAAAEYVPELQRLGRELCAMLLPDGLIHRLQQTPDVNHILFRCNPLLNGVPFDMVFLWNDFICFKYATGKELQTPNRPIPCPPEGGKLPYKGWSIVDPGAQLPACAREDFLSFRREWLAGPRNGKIDFTEASVAAKIYPTDMGNALCGPHFVNILSHHKYDERDPELSGYALGENLFTAEHFCEYLGGAGVRAPYLLLSVSCESGVTRGWEEDWPRKDRLHGMVDAAFRSGVRHYVSTLIKMPVCRSGRVFRPFYEAIADGWTVGEALRRARGDLRLNRNDPRDVGTVLGLAFVLYGNPTEAYLCAAGDRTDDLATATCAAQDGGRVCGRVVCQKDGGFAQALCDAHRTDTAIKCSAGHTVPDVNNLVVCSKLGCHNVLCQACAGWGKRLCWEHCCYKNHEIKKDSLRKTCPDTTGNHPEERRSVCPLDDGWMQGLCDGCLAATKPADVQPSCPHCARWINDENPWHGACADPGCGEQTCRACGPMHDATMYCHLSTRPEADRDTGWLMALSDRAQTDGELASPERIAVLFANAEQFQANLAQNLTSEIKPTGLARRLLLPVLDVGAFEAQITGVETELADIGPAMLESLQRRWSLPIDPASNTSQPWQPPQSWLSAPGEPTLAKINQLKIHKVRGVWGSPILVAVATLAPVEFQSQRGPVFVTCDAQHVAGIADVVRDWWRGNGSADAANIYLVAFGVTGWGAEVQPTRKPGLTTILASSQGGTWDIRVPPLSGTPAYVRRFVSMLTPVTVHQRREQIRNQVIEHLKLQDFVTGVKVQDELEDRTGSPVGMEDVSATFSELVETGRYAHTSVNDKDALRPTTPAQRAARLVRRRWVELLSWLIGVTVSVVVCQIRPKLLEWLPVHWLSGVLAAIFCAGVCHVLGQVAKRRVLRDRRE